VMVRRGAAPAAQCHRHTVLHRHPSQPRDTLPTYTHSTTVGQAPPHRKRREAAHCSHTLVQHLAAVVEGGESAAAAHCSQRLVRQRRRLSVSALDLKRRHRRKAPHQHAHGLVGGTPSQHQPHHQRIMYCLPLSAHQPHRGGGYREPQAALSLQQLQHLRQQLIRPPTRPPSPSSLAAACVASPSEPGCSPCVNAPPSVRAGVGPRTPCCPRGGFASPRSGRADTLISGSAAPALRPVAVSCAPCGQAPLQDRSAGAAFTTPSHAASTAATVRATTHTRRCWSIRDAKHSYGAWPGSLGRGIGCMCGGAGSCGGGKHLPAVVLMRGGSR
jgi:hypothetical protein